MKIPEYLEILYWVRIVRWVDNEAFGEVQHDVQFPSTPLTATTSFMFIDGRRYDLFTSDLKHWYIVIGYQLF